MKLSFFLAIILLLGSGLGFFSYKYWSFGPGVIILFISGILLALVYIFNKDINIWHHRKNKIGLDQKEKDFINNHFPLIHCVPQDSRDLFYKKISLFKVDKEFIGQGMDGVPYQAILLSGAYAAFFCLSKENYSVPFPKIPVYVFYNHAFPSPQFPKSLHISETHKEDGTLIFSIPHLLKGSYEPLKFFNSGLYESAKSAIKPDFYENNLPSAGKLCLLGGYTLQDLEKYMGIPKEYIDQRALAITLFYTRNQHFKKMFPVAFENLKAQMIYPASEEACVVN